MFKFRKIIGRFIALGILLSCLGFAVTASFAERAPAQMDLCRTCVQTGPHEFEYCGWYVVSSCATDPPIKNTKVCYTSHISCDVSDPE